mgnify:CR=1 FL=1
MKLLEKTQQEATRRLGLRQFNFRLMARLTGMMLIYLSACMLLPLAVSLYSRDGGTLVAYPRTRDELTLIPGVREIGDGACLTCPIRTLNLPGGIRRIGNSCQRWR